MHNIINFQWQGLFFTNFNTMWNKLPQDVVLCERVKQFQLKLKIFRFITTDISIIQ